MICPRCQTSIADSYSSCPRCGRSISGHRVKRRFAFWIEHPVLTITAAVAVSICLSTIRLVYLGRTKGEAVDSGATSTEWVVIDTAAPVHAEPEITAPLVGSIFGGSRISGRLTADGRWLETSNGFIPLSSLALKPNIKAVEALEVVKQELSVRPNGLAQISISIRNSSRHTIKDISLRYACSDPSGKILASSYQRISEPIPPEKIRTYKFHEPLSSQQANAEVAIVGARWLWE